MRSSRPGFPLVLFVSCALAVPLAARADTTLVPVGASWKYLDNGSNQGTAWRAPAFPDTSWSAGPAQLGYGDGDETTVVGYGPSAGSKYITTYFRNSFTVADPASFTGLTLRLLRDDGAVVYLNGTEVARSNMPSGTIGYTTPASTPVAGSAESTFVTFSLPATLVTAGMNVLAVEVHQESGASSDLTFALELIGTTSPSSPSLTRGPYLQSATPTSVVVRWRTSVGSDSRVAYGFAADSLTSSAADGAAVTEHEVTLTGLAPATKYYYSVGSSAATLASGADQFFWTPPVPSTAAPTRIWVVGDSGTADANARAVRNAYEAYTGTRYTDVFLMLGDNAYDNGTDAEYQAAVFDTYPKFLKQTALWPTIGNHDSADSPAPTSNLPYHRMFTLPRAAEAGGVASGTEDYYSFDYANIHFVCLDSMTTSRSPGSPMLTWLAQDLAANTQDWTIAFWHHPPYTKGSHDSDTAVELVQMRANVLPILEAYGVDLVLAGHSHTYERSVLLDGHYGISTTLTAAMRKDAGSGRLEDTGSYRKATAGPAPHEGTVYVVAGTSGSSGSGALNHPAIYASSVQLGSLVIDVSGNQLEATFLLASGAVGERFTMLKGLAGQPPATPSGLGATAVSASQVDLAWTDNAGDEAGYKIERSTSGGSFTQIATVAANVTGFSSTGLVGATTYSYRVRAYAAAGDSAYSNVATATTHAPPQATVPNAPTNLTALAAPGQVGLTWTDNSSNETGFRVERSTDGASWAVVATTGAGVASYADTGLAAATTYYHRVRAYNGAGDSAPSNVTQATTPLVALYDTALRAPACAAVSASCDSGTLLTGRGALGPEVGQPNTINGSCADGSSGAFHSDESNDRIRVFTTDGSAFAPGKTVRVEATVWAYSGFSSDRLDLYQASNATSPSWTLITTLAPAAAGAQVLSATYTLPSGTLQAVRARFRYQGSAAACGTGNYEDHDDLVFAVGGGAPDFSASAGPASLAVVQGASGSTSVTVASQGGFSSPVSLTASALPAGVSASFSANPVTPPANGSSGSTLTFTVSSSAGIGTFPVTVTATSGATVRTTTVSLAVASATAPADVVASYDATLRAPKCASAGRSCDSGTLLTGRGALGPEVGQPNTINGSCADGASGAFHADESNDRIRVFTTDGSALAPGKTVRVEATVWAYSGYTSDRLDLYQAPNATSPSWTLITTLAPNAAGAQVLSATYTLPAGALQAVRARFRYQGSAAACGTGNYEDHDDLVFAVGP